MKKFLLSINALFTLALALLCGYIFCKTYFREALWAAILVYVAGLAVGVFVADIVHELGHLFFGIVAKMGVKLNRFKLFSSVQSCSVNPKGERGMKGRFIVTVLGGLIFNALVVLLGVVSLFVPQITFLSCLLPASFYLLVLNALPFAYASGKTDGLVVAEVLEGESTAKVLLSILTVQAQVNGGKPLAEVDERLLSDLPQLPEDDVNFILLTELRYEYYAARGEEERAQRYLERYNELKEYL